MTTTTTQDEKEGRTPIETAEELKEILAKLELEYEKIKERVGKNAANVRELQHKLPKEEKEEVASDEGESWRVIGSGEFTDEPKTEENIFELPKDVYSFMATYSWKSNPFWLALIVVFGLQFVLLFLLLANQTDFQSDNPLQLPENVEISVRVSQVLLMVIAMFQQDDLLVGIETLVEGPPLVFLGKEKFKHLSRIQWNISCLIRMATGILGLLAAFILSIQSSTVFDVVLNVLGVEFVSNLDNVAFDLACKGYFGRYAKIATQDVSEATFHREKHQAWIKRVLHIIIALSVLSLILAGLVFIFYRQDSNFLSIREIQVQFDDDIVPFLGLFSGCYTAVENSRLRYFGDRRLFYVQDGFPQGGKFGFCSSFDNGESGWTFFVGDFRNPCGSYLMRSEDTQTFSILEAAETLEWFTAGEEEEPVGHIEISEMTNRADDCGHTYFEASFEACPVIQALGSISLHKLIGTNVSDNDSVTQIEEIRERGVLDPAVAHAIYYGESDSAPVGVYDLIFFAGRRWIWTTTDNIPGLQNATSPSKITDYFYSPTEGSSSLGLFRLVESLLATGGNQWVRFMSEPVDADTESPLGLEWFYPLYNDETLGANANDDSAYSSIIPKMAFPPPDTSRLLDSESSPSCQFCDLLKNPCFFDGECNEQTGVCNCRHGATGALCRDRPLANGICNLFFNSAEHDYDGGDCCASTCTGAFCGQDDVLDPYVRGVPSFNWLDASDSGDMFEITSKDDEWIEQVEGTTIAFGVNVTANLTYQFPPLRYEHCIDPDLAVIRIEVLPSPLLEESNNDLVFDGITLQCEDTTYLKTPIFRVSNYNVTMFSEVVRIPYGSHCAFGFQGPGYFRGVSLLAEGNAKPFINLQQSCSVDVYIPQSKCVWETFAEDSISVSSVGDPNCESSTNEVNEIRQISEVELDALGSDPILDGFCQQDPFQLLERFHVWDILSRGSGELVRASVGHVCDGGWNTGVFSVSCNRDRRISGLALKAGANASFVDSMTLNVKHFANLKRVEVQSGTGPVDRLLEEMATLNLTSITLGSDVLPSQIGLLQSLKDLRLTSGMLTSLPTEIGVLSNLEVLESHETSLRSLPSEIGSLTSLLTLDIGGNELISVATEIGLLERLEMLSLERNALSSLPSQIGLLSGLQQLLIQSNRISTLPSEIGMMTSLRSMDLANNTLVSLPSEIGRLSMLTSLDVTNNKNLSQIPAEVLAMTSLEVYV
ncbi:unnamed protein product [Cylindrotheca closterium]|uniref:EGF-like domain-containing protein n=1 Tax=Cylindrotheca closterium TaxID=2856 RepID=A0AAD2FKP9_9STRA|nr:unnamed protein product [Cylindrotheca closterium]